MAIAGTAGLAIEMVRLFQVELEHYEKIEGARLSLEGKAAFLARLVRNQLPMAFQGLVVVPLFAGYDELAGRGRLYTYDVVGGRYEENDFGSTGSGASLAKSYLRSTSSPMASTRRARGPGGGRRAGVGGAGRHRYRWSRSPPGNLSHCRRGRRRGRTGS